MNLETELQRYFGTPDAATITPDVLQSGVERMLVDLGLETDRSRRFDLWMLLYTLGSAPDLEAVFEEPEDRDAARSLMDLMDEEQEG